MKVKPNGTCGHVDVVREAVLTIRLRIKSALQLIETSRRGACSHAAEEVVGLKPLTCHVKADRIKLTVNGLVLICRRSREFAWCTSNPGWMEGAEGEGFN